MLTASSDELRKSIMSLLTLEFALKDFRPLSYFLSIVVTRHASDLFPCQWKYIEEIISRADTTSCKPISIPVDINAKLSASSGSPYEDPTHYHNITGALHAVSFFYKSWHIICCSTNMSTRTIQRLNKWIPLIKCCALCARHTQFG
jgi:hypothetical protein